MGQLQFFTDTPVQATKAVNVASVPHRSPFRYPGGKTWLVPRIRQWLQNLPSKPSTFYEPFAGGGIVSLTVAFERLADRVVLVEMDEDVAAVWQTILTGDADRLISRILGFTVTLDAVRTELGSHPDSVADRAFKTILKNRVYHGGILAAGSRPMKEGENGKGIGSRWYPETLAKRIHNIQRVKERIIFIQGDALEIIKETRADPDAAFFIDPPYTAAGKRAGARLYTHHELDHDALFSLVEGIAGDVLMTYDNAESIIRMAEAHHLVHRTIPMRNTRNAEMTELLIGSSLDWLPC
jgi:DNA adenine methylase